VRWRKIEMCSQRRSAAQQEEGEDACQRLYTSQTKDAHTTMTTNKLHVPVHQIVHDSHVISLLQQTHNGVAGNIPGPACH